MLFQNLIRISSGRGMDEVKDLGIKIPVEGVVKLGLGYGDGFDGELCISLPKPYLGCFGPKPGSSRAMFAATTGTDGGEKLQQAPGFPRL